MNSMFQDKAELVDPSSMSFKQKADLSKFNKGKKPVIKESNKNPVSPPFKSIIDDVDYLLEEKQLIDIRKNSSIQPQLLKEQELLQITQKLIDRNKDL